MLVGEPGVGKTRLADELAAHAQALGVQTLWGRCWEGGGAPAFWPWVQVLRSLAASRSPDELVALLGRDAEAIAQLAPDVVPGSTSRAPRDSSGGAASSAADSEQARFRLFDALSGFLVRASAARPLLVVVDDLHWADEASLRLLQFVVGELRGAAIALLGTYRDVEVRLQPARAALLAQLGRDAECIALRGLDRDSVAAYIEAIVGRVPSAALVEALHDATEGNPFFVEEVVRLMGDGGGLELAPTAPMRIPETVRETIRRRLELLSDATRSALAVASVLGRDFELAMLRRVMTIAGVSSGDEAAALGDRLDEAVVLRVVLRSDVPAGTFRFAHALIQETLYDDLEAARRVDLHRTVADVLRDVSDADPDRYYAELAHHALCAAPGGDVDSAVAFAVQAAHRAIEQHAYEAAANYYERAWRVARVGTPRDDAYADRQRRCAELLIGLGDALDRCGQTSRAAEAFLDAANLARTHQAPELLARAALGLGAIRIERGRANTQLAGLLDEALRGLPEQDSGLRARVMARFAKTFYLSGRQTPQAELSRGAVEMARRLGDAGALASALSARHSVLWDDGSSGERLTIATEMVRLAEAAADHEQSLEGQAWRIFDLLEIGAIAAVDGAIANYARHAATVRLPRPLCAALLFQTMRALLRGDLAQAEHLAHEALSVRQVEGQIPSQFFGTQMYLIRREQGRYAEVGTAVENLAEHFPDVPGWQCAAIQYLLDVGRRDEARRRFEKLASRDFKDIDRDVSWLTTMSVLAVVCAQLDDVRRAQQLFDLLLPWKGCNVVVVGAVACRGPVALYLGMLASTLSRFEDAAVYFESAIEMCERLEAWPLLAYSRYEYARLLQRQGENAEAAARAEALLRQAQQTAQQLGLVHLEAKLQGAVTVPASTEAPAAVGPALFRREGDFWTLTFAGSVARLKDSKGLRYLHELLRSPGVSMHSVALSQAVSGGAASPSPPAVDLASSELEAGFLGDAGEILDAAAVAAYKQRIRALEKEVAETRQRGEASRRQAIESELEMLSRELRGAVGLGGRRRKLGDPAELARVNVTKAISNAMKKLRADHPILADYLARTVKTGVYCSYEPERGAPVSWRL